MPAPVLAALTVLAAAYAAIAPPRRAFAILVGAIVLVPVQLTLPTGVTNALSVHVVVLIAVLGGLAWRTFAGRIPRTVWRATAPSLVWWVYLLVVVIVGIALTSPGLVVGNQLTKFSNIVEELAVLIAVTALARSDPQPRSFLRPLAVILLLSLSIAVIEHITGGSWGHWLFSHLNSQKGVQAASPLAERGGTLRVRAGAAYPLGFAWLSAALLPMLVVAVMRSRWRQVRMVLAGAAIALTIACIYWSYSRSALLGVVIALAVLGLAGRDRQVFGLVFLALVVGAVLIYGVPSIAHHFSSAVDTGSISVRQQRVPIVLGAVAGRPWTGLGLTGLDLVGLQGTDATYLLTYGEIGCVGLAALVAVLFVGMWSAGRGLFSHHRSDRLAAAALVGAAATVIASGFALDSLSLLDTGDMLWVFVGLATVLGERAMGTVRLRSVSPRWFAVPIAGGIVGALMLALAPVHHATTYVFSTLPNRQEAAAYNPVVTGNGLVDTACGAAEAQAAALPGIKLDCRNTFGAPGVGQLRVEAASAAAVRSDSAAVFGAITRAGVLDLRTVPVIAQSTGRPTALLTAPAWLAIFSGLLTLGTVPTRGRTVAIPAPRPPRAADLVQAG